MYRLVLIGLLLLTPAAAEDPEGILRQAFEAAMRNEKLAAQYNFTERIEERKLDGDGEVKGVEVKKLDVLFFDGDRYDRLIARDGQPLPPDEAAKEQRKLDKYLEELENESEKQRQKRHAKQEKELEERREMDAEILKAYDFTLVGEETIAGEPTWVIAGEPRPDYEPSSTRTKFLKKLRGKLWVSKRNYGWVRAEAETIDDASFGWFLFKLRKGAEFAFEQSFINGEVWMLDDFRLQFNAKLGLLKDMRRDVHVAWDDFRKFSAESRLIAAEPVEEGAPAEPVAVEGADRRQ